MNPLSIFPEYQGGSSMHRKSKDSTEWIEGVQGGQGVQENMRRMPNSLHNAKGWMLRSRSVHPRSEQKPDGRFSRDGGQT